MSYATPTFAGINLISPLPGTSVSVIPTGGSASRILNAKLGDFLSVMDFGATGNGTTDDTVALQNALNEGGSLYFPSGNYNYKISSPLTIKSNGTRFIGAGQTNTVITMSSASATAITFNPNLTNVELAGFTLTRSTTATSGGIGIDFSQSCSNCLIHDMHILNHYVGVQLGNTDTSWFMRSLVEKNQSHGVLHTTAANQGSALQWSMRDVLSQGNAGNGFMVSASGSTGVALGEWMHLETYANSGYGILVQGTSSAPINGFRLHDSFLGQDGNWEIYLDTYGGLHHISDTFTELAGTGSTGPTGGTAASNVGGGLLVTSNNTDIIASNLTANAHSDDGFEVAATESQFVGCRATNCGQHGVSVVGFSIPASGVHAMFTGCRSGNTGANTSQGYGIAVANGNNIVIDGCDLTGNTTAPFNDSAATKAQIGAGNLPNSVYTQVTTNIVTGSRSMATTYTNSTNKPMFVNVSYNNTTGSVVAMNGFINGVQVTQQYIPATSYGSVSLYVPQGATYQVGGVTGSPYLWVETY